MPFTLTPAAVAAGLLLWVQDYPILCSDNSSTTLPGYTMMGGAGRYNRAPMAGRLYAGGVNQRISSALYKVLLAVDPIHRHACFKWLAGHRVSTV
jgi:hypothetical protein